MTLNVVLRHRLGNFDLDVAFSGGAGVTALFGPSGAGKTTIINLVAGLERPAQGRVMLGDRVLVDTDRGLFVPPHRRRVGYVFQDSRLFPHLDVRRNLLYGHWFTPVAERRETLSRVVELLDLGPLLGRGPARLSGGERQRVALGRALLASPHLLLMDEPLASLDAARKMEILPYLERLHDEASVPIVYVSHELAEVARLATDLVVIAAGRVIAAGPVADVAARAEVTALLPPGEAGTILDARVIAVDAADDLAHVDTILGELRIAGLARPVGSRLRLQIRAKDVMIATSPPVGISALNVLSAVIGRIEPVQRGGGDQIITLSCGKGTIKAQVTRHSVGALGLVPGRAVHVVVKSAAIASGLRQPFA